MPYGPSGLWFGLEEVFVFDSKSENRDRAVEAVEVVMVRLRLGGGVGGLVPVATPDSVHSTFIELRLGLGLGLGWRGRLSLKLRLRLEGGSRLS